VVEWDFFCQRLSTFPPYEFPLAYNSDNARKEKEREYSRSINHQQGIHPIQLALQRNKPLIILIPTSQEPLQPPANRIPLLEMFLDFRDAMFEEGDFVL
jgi:hypothetical protein